MRASHITVKSTKNSCTPFEKSFIQLTDRVYQLETVVKMLLLAQTQLNEDVSVVLSALQGSSSLDKHMMRFGADDDDGLLN